MTEQQVVFRRKGSRVIYPYTEENAKKANLIPMTIAEAQEEGLLAPKAEVKEDPVIAQLREQNELLLSKIEALEKKPVRKKRAAKKPEPDLVPDLVPAGVEESKSMSVSDLLNS